MRTIQESFAIFFEENILSYFNVLATYPIKIVILAIDLPKGTHADYIHNIAGWKEQFEG